MRNAFILFGLLFLVLSCSDDDKILNRLEATGILGFWEVESRGVNDISSTEAFCCESFLFMDDSNLSDLKGTYTYDHGKVTTGTFELNIDDSSLRFRTQNGTDNELSYNLEGERLEIYYFEDDDRIWTVYSKSGSN